MGGMGGGGFRTGGIGLGGLLHRLVLGWLFGVDPLSFLSSDGTARSRPGRDRQRASGAADRRSRPNGGRVLGDTEDVWTRIFSDAGCAIRRRSSCSSTTRSSPPAAPPRRRSVPFYCPRDQKVYIDLSFFRDLDRRFGAPGDFAQAYVIAHEVGHHVQNLFGVLSGGGGNAQSVQQELQADCLAGMWGHSAGGRNYLEEGDVEEGLRAAAAIGDDRLQRASRGRVVPESFTHGSSAQRVEALRRGLSSSSLEGCGIRPR